MKVEGGSGSIPVHELPPAVQVALHKIHYRQAHVDTFRREGVSLEHSTNRDLTLLVNQRPKLTQLVGRRTSNYALPAHEVLIRAERYSASPESSGNLQRVRILFPKNPTGPMRDFSIQRRPLTLLPQSLQDALYKIGYRGSEVDTAQREFVSLNQSTEHELIFILTNFSVDVHQGKGVLFHALAPDQVAIKARRRPDGSHSDPPLSQVQVIFAQPQAPKSAGRKRDRSPPKTSTAASLEPPAQRNSSKRT